MVPGRKGDQQSDPGQVSGQAAYLLAIAQPSAHCSWMAGGIPPPPPIKRSTLHSQGQFSCVDGTEPLF